VEFCLAMVVGDDEVELNALAEGLTMLGSESHSQIFLVPVDPK
jgi:hypothetical protein